MGCDIHAYAEKLVSYEDKSFWHCCDRFGLCAYTERKILQGEQIEPKFVFENIYEGRNYKLFEALAGVRGYDENALFEIKGDIPKDASRIVRETYENGKIDYHTPSYITIKELFSVDSTVKRTNTGYITQQSANMLKDTAVVNQPISYMLEPVGRYDIESTWTEVYDPLVEFKKAYLESYKREFYLLYCSDEEVLNSILRDGDKYRIVFWFDN